MPDRGIIFSAPMVRALIEGRKTQTRRLAWVARKSFGYITTNPEQPEAPAGDGKRWMFSEWLDLAPGDRLYVREAWGLGVSDHGDCPRYRATMDYQCGDKIMSEEHEGPFRWRPSIHMPRWASRITLTVTEVRVQRLQEISEADAVAEGCGHDSDGWRDYQFPATQCCGTARESYRTLWNSLHGPDAWDANPWVAAISFTVRQGNIDA